MRSIKKLFDDEIRDITSLGGFAFYAIITLSFLLLDQHLMSLFLALGFLFSLGVTIIIRAVWFRKRPQKQEYSDWIGKLDASSFPSLHSNRAIFLMIALSRYFNEAYMTILLAVVALLVLYSRSHMKKHHVSDIVVGALLGAAEYYLLVMVF
ncbi:phosphatase PAP2 family protein [Candidatus Woesearchaeota archaeon]|nr:phosphatase PAP2 family protein [Candidatus Woesearchaeota archaeon]